MRKRILIFVALLLVGLVTTVTYFSIRPTTRHITLQAFDFFFLQPGTQGNNPTLTVNEGDTVVLTVENKGEKDHEFFVLTSADYNSYMDALKKAEIASENERQMNRTIVEPREPVPAFVNGSVEDVSPGTLKTNAFVVDKPGVYVYACLDKDGTSPEIHAVRGMFGIFQVQTARPLDAAGNFGVLVTNNMSAIPSIVLFQLYILAALAILCGGAGEKTELDRQSRKMAHFQTLRSQTFFKTACYYRVYWWIV